MTILAHVAVILSALLAEPPAPPVTPPPPPAITPPPPVLAELSTPEAHGDRVVFAHLSDLRDPFANTPPQQHRPPTNPAHTAPPTDLKDPFARPPVEQPPRPAAAAKQPTPLKDPFTAAPRPHAPPTQRPTRALPPPARR